MRRKIIFIRHGEPRYDEVKNDSSLMGGGYVFGRLTEKGREQAETVADNPVLKGSQLILSSPYTRALETAATISRKLNIPLIVEHNLHEWSPDKNGQVVNLKDIYAEFEPSQGIKLKEHQHNWESVDEMKERLFNVLDKYKKYEKIIVVCHGILIKSTTYFEDRVEHCGIRELDI